MKDVAFQLWLFPTTIKLITTTCTNYYWVQCTLLFIWQIFIRYLALNFSCQTVSSWPGCHFQLIILYSEL